MQSNLKKSLYLGLAALSFASVASVTATASNANAASKKAAAKKVTYKTTNRNLDQSVVFASTGKNAVYSKPGTVKGAKVVATKADMGSKANSKSVNDNFMAYQEAVTSKGVHYYKVVSFDKKVRGYVYVGGVNKVDGKTSTATPSNTTGYLKSNRVFNVAYGSQFGAKLKNFNGIDFSTHKFTVNDAVQVRNGAKYYNVTDQSNAMVNGWVNADYFSNDATDAVNQAQNNSKAVKLTFYNVDNSGIVMSSKSVQPNGGFYDISKDLNTPITSYSKGEVLDAINASLVGTGYTATGVYNNVTNPNQPVRKGDSLNVQVRQSAKLNAKFTPYGLTSGSNGSVNSTPLDVSKFAGISDSQFRDLVSAQNDTVSFDKMVSEFFDNGKVWNVVKGDDGNTYTFDKTATMRAFNDKLNQFNNNSNYYNNEQSNNNSSYRDRAYTFETAFNNGSLPVYYTKDTSNNTSSVFNASHNDSTGRVIVNAFGSNQTPQKDSLVASVLKSANTAKDNGQSVADFASQYAKANTNDALNNAFVVNPVSDSDKNINSYAFGLLKQEIAKQNLTNYNTGKDSKPSQVSEIQSILDARLDKNNFTLLDKQSEDNETVGTDFETLGHMLSNNASAANIATAFKNAKTLNDNTKGLYVQSVQGLLQDAVAASDGTNQQGNVKFQGNGSDLTVAKINALLSEVK
ncbi:hypothetical protein MOO46_06785 [Apilactobacillus apisilvae]|uniref:S-layer protein n=1 Tax=Apilactobacillus apisilvae TaxID=2923364 RepID=A0ABY4PHG0_9LACO|nr:hypothetical protein [Apilactobacillus apisilvae]UQS84943.1 hypothetical protein MOO46_06785 [Apilactobacillus apisilvae]